MRGPSIYILFLFIESIEEGTCCHRWLIITRILFDVSSGQLRWYLTCLGVILQWVVSKGNEELQDNCNTENIFFFSQNDYHNLIGITADLVDALEATVQGRPVSC